MANVPEEIIEAIRLGRLTALSGAGDCCRRHLEEDGRKQISKQVKEATAPFQCAISTKAGCERRSYFVIIHGSRS